MKAIYFFNFKKEIKSSKSVIISSIFILISFLIAKYGHSLGMLIGGKSPALEFMFGIYALITFLFSTLLFSNIMTKDIQQESIRYISPYITRKKLYLSKFLIMFTYFVLVTFVSLIFLFAIRREFYIPIREIFNLIVFYAYVESLILLISTLNNNEKVSSLIGIIMSFIAPVLFFLISIKNNRILNLINWLLPYKYLESSWEIIGLIVLTALLLLTGLYIFERKEL